MLSKLPNIICFTRLAAVPVLWVLALLKLVWPFTILLALAYLSDKLDGYLCRKYRLETAFGAKLDRIADDFLILNTLVWLYVIRPELFRDHWPVLSALLLGLVVSLGLQYLRFGRKVPFHLTAGKISNWAIGLFAIHTFLFGPYPWLLYIAAIVIGYALLEEIILVATRDDLDEHVMSMFSKRRRTPAT